MGKLKALGSHRLGVKIIRSLCQISWIAIIAVVALRIGIGLHFYTEGVKKVRDPSSYSAGFFRNAKGRFAPVFRSLIWDTDGLARLDREGTVRAWDQYRQAAISRYGLNEKQQEQAAEIYKRRRSQLETWFRDIAGEIKEYKQGLQRRDRDHRDPNRMEVASLRGQVNKLEAELNSKRRELTGPIDAIREGYARDLHRLAGQSRKPLRISKPGQRWIDSESIDSVIRYFDVAIGILLFLGLFTRTAATLAALFLCSVIASQWPGSPGAIPVWSQFIEALGLFVLAAIGAGRYAGLDFILGSARQWCCRPQD